MRTRTENDLVICSLLQESEQKVLWQKRTSPFLTDREQCVPNRKRKRSSWQMGNNVFREHCVPSRKETTFPDIKKNVFMKDRKNVSNKRKHYVRDRKRTCVPSRKRGANLWQTVNNFSWKRKQWVPEQIKERLISLNILSRGIALFFIWV
jgi:hypothetical protein